MADSSVSRPDHPATKKGIFGKTFDLLMKIIGILLISALMSVIIEWIGMAFFYSDPGHSHAERMMKEEISYLGSSLDGDDLNGDVVQAASSHINDVVTFLFIDSGVIDSISAARSSSPEDGHILRFVKELVAEFYHYIMAAVYILVMFFIRLTILMLSMPAFILFGFVGVSDGLMQRDLRRWCGGNESGFIYHWAKRFAMPVLVIAWILYLAIPTSIHPNLIITPFAVLFGLVLMIMAAKFKKYL